MKIKKYQEPNDNIKRKYRWGSLPETDKTYYDYRTNKIQEPGDTVLLDSENDIVTADRPWAVLDYSVLTNPDVEFVPPEGLLSNITITTNGNSNINPLDEFKERYQTLLTAPIATSKQLEQKFNQQGDLQAYESGVTRDLVNKYADKEANRKTPGTGTFVIAPLTLLGLGIEGASAIPYLLPGTIGGDIIGTTAFAEALNHAIKYGTGKTMGEHAVNAARYLGIPESLWRDFGIQMIGDLPLYVGGEIISKAITNAGRTLGREALLQMALNETFKGIPINPTTKDLARAMNTEVKNKRFVNLFPGQIGWAPRQTLTGYHASNKPIQEFNYWYPNWAVTEHNAPHGIYFTTNETRPSGGFLAKRPYIEQVTSTFDKPMIQVGEISNATRSSIERQAQSMGADGIIYQGIKDNQLKNQTIVKTLNPDLRVNVSEIIENDPYLVTKILDKDKIRLRLPTHTKDLPREIVLEPQGNNQYRIHIRTWNGDHISANLDPKEKQALFEAVYNELPEGAEILFPESSADYPATRGTVAALTRLSRDPRFQRGNTTGTLIYTDKDGNLQTFTGNSFIKGLFKLGGKLIPRKYKLGDKIDKNLTSPEERALNKSNKATELYNIYGKTINRFFRPLDINNNLTRLLPNITIMR